MPRVCSKIVKSFFISRSFLRVNRESSSWTSCQASISEGSAFCCDLRCFLLENWFPVVIVKSRQLSAALHLALLVISSFSRTSNGLTPSGLILGCSSSSSCAPVTISNPLSQLKACCTKSVNPGRSFPGVHQHQYRCPPSCIVTSACQSFRFFL